MTGIFNMLVGLGGGSAQLFVEDVFSTYLYTGNGSTQTITNGINLSGEGGLVWSKDRPSGNNHLLFDSARGYEKILFSNSTSGQVGPASSYPTPQVGGGYTITGVGMNGSGITYVNWTFREAPNFFDVVTYTGNGTAGRAISHSLGVAPGCMIIKRISGSDNWQVWHRSLSNPQTKLLFLNSTAAEQNQSTTPQFGGQAPTATDFFVGSDSAVNASGNTYVAYLFAHVPGSDGIIQCGSFTGAGTTVNLGWEPQWLLMKQSSEAGDWFIADNMRGMPVQSSATATLFPNTSSAEGTFNIVQPTSTGFVNGGNGGTIVYVAIRRGPMKTPTLGTSVFAAQANGNSLATPPYIAYNSNFPIDMFFQSIRAGGGTFLSSRLTAAAYMGTYSTAAEAAGGETVNGTQTGVLATGSSDLTGRSAAMFRRAPGFMDVVCYTGTGVAGRTVNHNLGVAPELMIVKRRNAVLNWVVYNNSIGNSNFLVLNLNNAVSGATYWNNTDPTSTQFTLGGSSATNFNGGTYVAYLFASAPGVSKVGSYTGNGSSQTINCAFTTGARYVLIKRTDSTGDWYVWDSARGIVAGNDPYLALNTTAAEVTSNDSVDTDNTGFIVNQVAASNINVNAATYIFLAIA